MVDVEFVHKIVKGRVVARPISGKVLVNPDPEKTPITHDTIDGARELAKRLAMRLGKDVFIIDDEGYIVEVIRYEELKLTEAPVVIHPIELEKFEKLVVE